MWMKFNLDIPYMVPVFYFNILKAKHGKTLIYTVYIHIKAKCINIVLDNLGLYNKIHQINIREMLMASWLTEDC